MRQCTISMVILMSEKEDLRIVKTKKLLYSSLIKLMKDKSFEEIKVADICSDALINRSTFYAHYADKYELLLDLIETLKTNLLSTLEKNEHIVNTKGYFLEMIRLILEHIDSQKEIYHSIILSNRSSILVDILTDVAVRDINKRIEISNIQAGNVPTDILVQFYLGAVFNVGLEWLQGNSRYTQQQILYYLGELIPEAI